MSTRLISIRDSLGIFAALLAAGALYYTSQHNYLLFHSLIELFTIIVAAGIFVIAWNARGFLNNNYLLFIGIASLFVAFLDLLHTLAYQGMGVFPGQTANLATQLWIAGRYLQSISWLLAPAFLGRRLRLDAQIGAYTLVTGLLLLSIFTWHIFPSAYLEGTGLTSFKKISEYIIAGIFLLSIAALVRKRQEFDPRVRRLVAMSLMLTVGAELAFSSYVSVYGPANMVGHFLRLVAFYLLYKAIIETGLIKPYAILLRNLKQSEDRLVQYAATLEARNEQLVAAENQLREERAALQAQNEELDAYAHTVAHDLKNPLAVIIASSDVINEVTNLTHRDLRDFLKQIKYTAFEMNSIIDSLLLLAEVRKGEAPMAPIDMAEVVQSVRKRLNYMVKEFRGHVIYPKSWPSALGYGPWVEEIWANYISNALKYGGPAPQIELGANPQPDGTIRFWTRDNGPGVPPDAQANLFTPFTQLGKVRRGGHGLGLSIVLRIVRRLGGQAGVESVIGAGSTFYFTLPAAAEAATAAVAEPQTEPETA